MFDAGLFVKAMREYLGISRIFSSYVWSHLISFPDPETVQIGIDTFLTCLSNPKNAVGNVLIIQGGVKHLDSDSYYVRLACALLDKNVRVFLIQKLRPMINFDYGHDVADVMKYIREKYKQKIVIVGFSMGGLVLLSYLSLGYDQADLYIPVCCTLNLPKFNQLMDDHAIFRMAKKRSYTHYGVKDQEGLMALAHTTQEDHQKFMNSFLDNLNKYRKKWVKKTKYIIASDDPITSDYEEWIEWLRKKPKFYIVKGGWHCCLDTVYTTTKMVGDFFK